MTSTPSVTAAAGAAHRTRTMLLTRCPPLRRPDRTFQPYGRNVP